MDLTEMTYGNTAEDVFDRWALDYHAPGMEDDHWPSVREAVNGIPISSGRYLEIGVGNGYGIRHVASHQFETGHCTGIDVSANMIDLSRKRTGDLANVELHVADFLSWQPETKFDLIFSMEVFYYLPDMQAGLARARELLNPGGRLMVLVNRYAEYTESHDWAAQLDTEMALWSAERYREGFEAAGFNDVQQELLCPRPPTSDSAAFPGTLYTSGIRRD